MTGGRSNRTVYLATGLTAIVGLCITGFSFLFGDLVIRILGGAQYTELGSEAWLFALEGSAFALVQVLLYARLATQDRKAVIAVWVALVAQVAIISLWRHDSLVEIVTTVVAVSLVLTVVGPDHGPAAVARGPDPDGVSRVGARGPRRPAPRRSRRRSHATTVRPPRRHCRSPA